MEVGDYVRTIKGFGKIEKIEILKKDTIIYLDSGITIDYITKDFTKDELNKMYPSSPNKIDLIQAGDYVNGYYVEDVLNTFVNVATGSNYFQSPTIYEDDIKSIVTHEQFSAMEYRIGDKDE